MAEDAEEVGSASDEEEYSLDDLSEPENGSVDSPREATPSESTAIDSPRSDDQSCAPSMTKETPAETGASAEAGKDLDVERQPPLEAAKKHFSDEVLNAAVDAKVEGQQLATHPGRSPAEDIVGIVIHEQRPGGSAADPEDGTASEVSRSDGSLSEASPASPRGAPSTASNSLQDSNESTGGTAPTQVPQPGHESDADWTSPPGCEVQDVPREEVALSPMRSVPNDERELAAAGPSAPTAGSPHSGSHGNTSVGHKMAKATAVAPAPSAPDTGRPRPDDDNDHGHDDSEEGGVAHDDVDDVVGENDDDVGADDDDVGADDDEAGDGDDDDDSDSANEEDIRRQKDKVCAERSDASDDEADGAPDPLQDTDDDMPKPRSAASAPTMATGIRTSGQQPEVRVLEHLLSDSGEVADEVVLGPRAPLVTHGNQSAVDVDTDAEESEADIGAVETESVHEHGASMLSPTEDGERTDCRGRGLDEGDNDEKFSASDSTAGSENDAEADSDLEGDTNTGIAGTDAGSGLAEPAQVLATIATEEKQASRKARSSDATLPVHATSHIVSGESVLRSDDMGPAQIDHFPMNPPGGGDPHPATGTPVPVPVHSPAAAVDRSPAEQSPGAASFGEGSKASAQQTLLNQKLRAHLTELSRRFEAAQRRVSDLEQKTKKLRQELRDSQKENRASKTLLHDKEVQLREETEEKKKQAKFCRRLAKQIQRQSGQTEQIHKLKQREHEKDQLIGALRGELEDLASQLTAALSRELEIRTLLYRKGTPVLASVTGPHGVGSAGAAAGAGGPPHGGRDRLRTKMKPPVVPGAVSTGRRRVPPRKKSMYGTPYRRGGAAPNGRIASGPPRKKVGHSRSAHAITNGKQQQDLPPGALRSGSGRGKGSSSAHAPADVPVDADGSSEPDLSEGELAAIQAEATPPDSAPTQEVPLPTRSSRGTAGEEDAYLTEFEEDGDDSAALEQEGDSGSEEQTSGLVRRKPAIATQQQRSPGGRQRGGDSEGGAVASSRKSRVSNKSSIKGPPKGKLSQQHQVQPPVADPSNSSRSRHNKNNIGNEGSHLPPVEPSVKPRRGRKRGGSKARKAAAGHNHAQEFPRV